MITYIRQGRKVTASRGFQTQVTCVRRVKTHIDDSRFSYECGIVRHAVRRSTVRGTSDVRYVPASAVIERVMCDCQSCFNAQDLDDIAEKVMIDCMKRVLRPDQVPESIHDQLYSQLEQLCSGECCQEE